METEEPGECAGEGPGQGALTPDSTGTHLLAAERPPLLPGEELGLHLDPSPSPGCCALDEPGSLSGPCCVALGTQGSKWLWQLFLLL